MRVFIFLLALLLCGSGVFCSSKHPSPIELYGQGGRDIFTHNVLTKQEIVSCFFSICDFTRDQQLDKVELNKCLSGPTAYLTAFEASASNLNSYSLLKQCDFDGDHLISFQEMHDSNCVHMAQLEAMAANLCSRAQHGEYTYEEWRARYIAVKNIKSLSDAEMMAFRLIDREVNPHRGEEDMQRVGTPFAANSDKIGGKITPEFVIALVYLGFTILMVVLFSQLLFDIITSF
jgi:hypothetical protein